MRMRGLCVFASLLLCDKDFNAERAEEQRRHFYKINRIGRKSAFGIKTERFCGKIRVIL
jgi:hypothetical protein